MTVWAGVVADKISVNTQAGYSGEGPNENAVALLGDNKTVICIMRRDSAVSPTHLPLDLLCSISSNTASLKSLLVQEGMQGWNGSRPFGATPPEVSYAIAKSTDRGGSWKLTLAPSFMLSCRPRAVTLSRFGTVLVSGGRPPLSVWATRDGESWTAYDIPSEHNRLVPPAMRFCPEYSRGVNDTFQQSSGYTSINVL
jgi:hypothetical protein